MTRFCPPQSVVRVLVAITLTLAGQPARVVAQGNSDFVYILHSTNPDVPDLDIRQVHHGFNLFANADGASTGFRMTGNFGPKMDNYSPCSNTLYSCQNVRIHTTRGYTQALWFQLEWAYGVPPHDFLKIKAVAPSVANAIGEGWSAGTNDQVLGRPNRFGPADGSLGRLFAGVTSTTDSTCRDFTGFGNASHPAGIPLLAGSGCPETWPSTGWGGDAPIRTAAWKSLFDAQGASFAWDFWRVPPEKRDMDRKFLGTGWSTYGETSDFYRDILGKYGDVAPGGVGVPTLQGYPLGLLLRFDAFTFGQASVSGVQYIQVLIINRSEDLWGQPIDYDSLYFGITEGKLLGSDNHSSYYMPGLDLMLFHETNAVGPGGPCEQAFRTPPGVDGCLGSTSGSRGYGNGAGAIIFFKTPLGDMRNKLFTRTNGHIVNGAVVGAGPCTVGVDPFCMPSHPNRGDTITFNRGGYGGYGLADAFTWGSGARPSFGMISGTEDNTIAGRDLAAYNPRLVYRTFPSLGYPAVTGKYPKYVPGQGGEPGATWDWNHDGVPDTLTLDSCGPNGCVAFSHDTSANGLIDRSGNVGGVMSFGPFRLKGGDTTSFVFALVGGADSADVWSQIDGAIDEYQTLYLAPEAPPASKVVFAEAAPASADSGTLTPQVTLAWSDAAEHWSDPYLTKVADDIARAPANSPYGMMATDNPGLVAAIRAAASNNLEAIEIYKSCDGGQTFTASVTTCVGTPTYDDRTRPVGLGWAPYAVFNAGGSGANLPHTFTDPHVSPGRSYLYTIVGKSRGAAFLYNRRTSSSPVTLVPDTIRFAASIRNPLATATTDPNVASVYVPVSEQAGFVPAHATLTSDPYATVPVNLTFTSTVVPGAYRGIFGNTFIVERDSLMSTGDIRTVVTVEDVVVADSASVGVNRIVASATLTRTTADVLPANYVGGTVSTSGPAPVTAGSDTIRTTTTYRGITGFVLARDTIPLWLSASPNQASTTPAAAITMPDFPGFTVSVGQNLQGTFNGTTTGTQPETQLRGNASLIRLNLPAADTIVPRDIVNRFMVQWAEPSSTSGSGGRGVYQVTWTGDPFGTTSGFVLNQLNPSATAAELAASLRARLASSMGATDSLTAALTGVVQTRLVPVHAPFSIRNMTFNRPVTIAMAKRTDSTVLLGNGTDTIRVTVPADQWIPGDHLFFLEDVRVDSTRGGRAVLDGLGKVIQVTHRQVTFSPAVLGCNTPRISCNPVVQGTPGATGYAPMSAGDRTRWEYYAGFTADSRFTYDVVGPVTGAAVTQVSDSTLKQIRVVPNPFVVYSQYLGTDPTHSAILFTNVPSAGTIRIYTVSGQFVQQITWTLADLAGDGDLFYDLTSYGGRDIASGLYIWVLTTHQNPNDASSPPLTARGKFVVIQGGH